MIVVARDDDRLLSPCCAAPQYMAMGRLTGTGLDWVQEIEHRCSKCSKLFDPKDGKPGPGTAWRARHPEPTPTTPEAT